MYQEFHFNSRIFNSTISGKGKPARKTLELNSPITLRRFQVKSVEFPARYKNVYTRSIFTLTITYGVTLYNLDAFIDDGTYTATEFASEVHKKIRAILLDAEMNEVDVEELQVEWTNEKSETAEEYETMFLSIRFPANFGEEEFQNATLTFEGQQMADIFSTDLNESIPYYNPLPGEGEFHWVSPYPVKLRAEYFYLHSNLMLGTSDAAHRALGSWASRTIMAKIPLETSPDQLGTIIKWNNENLSSEFMYSGNGQEYTQVEFWFTDEAGNEIDFNNLNFSLTLACIL